MRTNNAPCWSAEFLSWFVRWRVLLPRRVALSTHAHRWVGALLTFGTLVPFGPAVRCAAGDVDDLLTALDDDDYEIREKASADLLNLMCDAPENYSPVVSAVNNAATPPEARARAQQVVAQFINKLPAVKALDEDLGMSVIEGLTEFDTVVSALWMGCDFTYFPQYDTNQMLLAKWEGARGAMSAGNIPGAIDKLCVIETCLANLTEQQVLDLGFNHGTGFEAVPSGKDFLLAKVQLAKIDAVQAGLELMALIQGDDTVLSFSLPVPQPGELAFGRTLSLHISNLTTPGAISAFLPAVAENLFLPRPSWEVVGPVYDLLAERGLGLTGPLLVSMEYSPALEQAQSLRIGRLADGQFQLLSTVSLDTTSHRLTAFFQAPSTGNPLGEFYLLRIPEPPGWTLGLIAGLLLMARTRRLAGNGGASLARRIH